MNKSIGIFDSGVGGLTVLTSLTKLLPNESYIYIGDNKNCPYGDKTKEELFCYATRIIDYLIKRKVKLIVIACNTISSNILDDLTKRYQNVKIIGVIDATINEFIKKSIDEVLVMATNKTIESNVYQNRINSLNPNIRVINLKTPLLVPAIEQNIQIDETIKKYLTGYSNIKSIILGCTHYPLAIKYIKKYTNATIVTSGDAIAKEIYQYLYNNHLFGNCQNIDIYTTGDLKLFNNNCYKTVGVEGKRLNI